MENEKIVGYWTLSNLGGLSVTEIHDDEALTVRWYDNEKTETCEIIYELNEDTEEHEPCINYHGTLYWLSECMRTNY